MMFVAAIVAVALIAALLAALPLWRRQRRGEAVLASVFVVGTAVGVYLLIGRPDLALQPPPPAEPQSAEDVVAMIEQLAERLEEAPDDPQGWTMLGRAYVLMGRYQDATRAFNEAMSRTSGEDPDLVASYAEARVLGNPAALEGEAGALFERVLELDPGNPRGLWYGGLAAEARDDSGVALERFRKLLARDLPPDFRQVVESRVASLDPAALGALVTVKVELAPELANPLPPNAVLFVFLREDETASGPPLAARRLGFFDFPETVPLTPGDLIRGGELAAGEYFVGARLSVDGDATPGPGDLVGIVRWHSEETDEVRVTLTPQRGE